MNTNTIFDVRSLEALKTRHRGKRIVFVSGNFNIIHPGHIRLLNFSRSCGDCLVVGLFKDGSLGTMVRMEDRRLSLMALEVVDEVVALHPDDLLPCIAMLQPHTVVKGKEHEPYSQSEQEVVSSYGGHLLFSAGEQQFSSRDLIRQELAHPSKAKLPQAVAALQRLNISRDALASRVRRFGDFKVLVVGDLIIDEYIYCDPLGMSQEDPTIVVSPVETKRFVGAAGIVAAHLAGLGAQVRYMSIVGNDPTAAEALSRLEGFGVKTHFVYDQSRPTILKQRYKVQSKTMLRVSHLRAHDAAQEYRAEVLTQVSAVIKELDAVVFSDFNYGCLPQPLVDGITALCRDNGVPYFADSQASSQVGDVSRFKSADFLSATEREARLALNDFKSGIQNIANRLLEKSASKSLILKLGAEGLISVTHEPEFVTRSLPAFNSNPVDVAGAGDALLAAASLYRLTGGSILESAYIGSLAAGVQVSRVGNMPLSAHDLLGAIIE